MDSQSTTSVQELACRCAQEMEAFRHHRDFDAGPCYELFRRALVHQDQEAWTAVYAQYYHLVCHWLGSPPGDVDTLANDAFQRFWRALPPHRFAAFPTLDQLLAYLKRSAQSASMDWSRQEQKRQAQMAAMQQLHSGQPADRQASVAGLVLDEIAGAELYEYLTGSLNSPQERLVFRASVEWNLKPRMIAERWPDLFRSPEEVSTVKERLFRRLQRDPKLRALLGIAAADGGKT